MASIRKPKRIVIRGHDEREYPFLVKGGEDLRQDQRLEQLFEVMNIILARDAACSQRGLQLRTYRVVPMTSRCCPALWVGGSHRQGALQNSETLGNLGVRSHFALILQNSFPSEERTVWIRAYVETFHPPFQIGID